MGSMKAISHLTKYRSQYQMEGSLYFIAYYSNSLIFSIIYFYTEFQPNIN